MNLTRTLLLLGFFAFTGCKSDDPPTKEARLRLARRPAGRVAIELSGLDGAPAALQVTLVTTGGTHRFEAAAAPSGVPIDTVRLEVREPHRAILFVGDKRGAALPQIGEVATLAITKAGAEGGELSIASAVLVDAEGLALPVDFSGTLVLP